MRAVVQVSASGSTLDQDGRYFCHSCGQTFAETKGTPLYGLKYPLWQVVIVLTLLAFGFPSPAIVAAFGVDERTVATWQSKAGQHAKALHEHVVGQGQVDLGQVQADELYVKTECGTVWVATAISVFSRLFLWGAIAPQRDEELGHRSCRGRATLRQARSADTLGRGWLPSRDHRRAQGLPGPAAHLPARAAPAARCGPTCISSRWSSSTANATSAGSSGG